jgi:hypothetical protein
MNPSLSRLRPSPAIRAAAWTAAAALALSGCIDRLAGTSVGTGNPTEIQVAFRDSTGAPVAVTGSLQVYASTQIPVPGFAPNPLLTVDVAGASSASLKAEAFQGLADSLWPKGSIDSGAYEFNVVVAGGTQGAVLRGFSFRKDGSAFDLRAQAAGDGVNGKVAEIEGTLAPLVDIECALDTNELSMNWDNYLFLYGTGYAAKGVKGKFVLHGIPKKRHAVSFISVPGKDDPSGGGSDSLFVYGLNVDIVPDKINQAQLGDLQSSLPTPELLKPQ